MTPATPAAEAGSSAEKVREIAAGAVAPYGLLVDDVAVVAAGARRIVRLSLDRDVSTLPAEDHTSVVPPVDLDEVADASRSVDQALEAHATALFGNAPYLLEIGSAGAERRLSLPRHFRVNVGRLVELHLVEGRQVVGRIVAATPEHVTVRPQADPEAAGKPGKPRKSGKRSKHGGSRGAARDAHGGPATGTGVAGPEVVLGYGDIARARVRIEFGRPDDEWAQDAGASGAGEGEG